MKILLGDFNAKVGRENIFKPKIGNESLHRNSIANGVGIVNFANKKTSFYEHDVPAPKHSQIHWITPVGKTHNQINHIRGCIKKFLDFLPQTANR
jgi:hypothetical protein